MNAEILRDKLLDSASSLGWPAAPVPEFTRARFRGREDESGVALPKEVYGLRLGDYPVLVAPILLGTVDEMQTALRQLHSQMVMARSYMRAEEVINAHIMLCAVNPPSAEAGDEPLGGDWRGAVDLAQRDETVCRKIIWIPDANAVDASYARFLGRTFLAMPWHAAHQVLNAPLDQNENLVERTLVAHGLAGKAAAKWARLADELEDDPDALVAALVSAMEEE